MTKLYLSDFKKQILKEGTWVFSGEIATAFALLIGIRLLTEFLPRDVYGSISLMLGIAALGHSLYTYPLLQAATRFYPDLASSGEVWRLRRILQPLLLKLTIALTGMILIGGAIHSKLKGTSYLLFVSLAGILFVEVFRSLETTFFLAARRQRLVSIWQVLEAWGRPLIAILAVIILGASSSVVIFSYFIVTGSGLLCLKILPFKLEGFENNKNKSNCGIKLRKGISHFALPLVPLILVGWILSLSDRYIINAFLGLENVGIYAATYGLMNKPFIMVQGIIARTLRPVYFNAISGSNFRLEIRVIYTWFISTALVCLAGVVLVYFLSNFIANIFLAKDYRAGAALMPWIAAGSMFQACTQVLEIVFYGNKRTKDLFWGKFISSIICVVSVAIMVKYYNLLGAAMACPVYYGCSMVIFLFLCRFKTNIFNYRDLIEK